MPAPPPCRPSQRRSSGRGLNASGGIRAIDAEAGRSEAGRAARGSTIDAV